MTCARPRKQCRRNTLQSLGWQRGGFGGFENAAGNAHERAAVVLRSMRSRSPQRACSRAARAGARALGSCGDITVMRGNLISSVLGPPAEHLVHRHLVGALPAVALHEPNVPEGQ